VAQWRLHPQNDALELALAPTPAGTEACDVADPFLTLGDRGTFSRTVLGIMVGPRGEAVLEIALKLQSDEYPSLSEGAGLTNDDVEAGWEREIGLLDAIGDEGGIPATAEVLARNAGAAALLPPTIFCKRRRAYFVSACPDCGQPLADVRDNRLLEDRGLARRDRSLVRYIGCTPCINRSRDARLWTLVREDRGGEGVGDQTDLFRAYRELARREGDHIPCQGCPHTPTCFPDEGAGDVVRCLTPLTFFESRALATEVLQLRYDECSALIGGASFDAVVRGIAEQGRQALVRRRARALARQSPYFFAADPTGKLGLESLRLKVGLFAHLCAATAALHRHTRGPHLGIVPSRVLGGLPNGADDLPWLWGLTIRLAGLGNAQPRTADATSSAAYARPRLVEPVFAAPSLRQAPVADVPVTVTPRRIGEEADGTILELDVRADSVDAGSLSDRDGVEIAIVQGRPPLSLLLSGTIVGQADRTLQVRTGRTRLDATTLATLRQLVGQPLSRGRLTVQPCLHVPADVHSLGMMLLVSLLANEQRGAAQVAAAVQDVCERLALAARGRAMEDDRVIVEQAIRLLGAEAFAKDHILANPGARPEIARAIPDGLWLEALLVGLRCVTTLRGFSVCRSPADFDPGHPEVKTEFLLQMVRGLGTRIDAVLFGLPGRARELHQVLARVARETKVE
jgi:hypothetical protein